MSAVAVEKHWSECIPEHGCWCWVTDHHNEKARLVVVMAVKDKWFYDAQGRIYKFARLASKADVLKYVF